MRLLRLCIFAPEVPDDRIDVITAALIKALQDPRTLEWSKKVEVPVNFVDSSLFRKRLKDIMEIFKRHPKEVEMFIF